MLTQIWSMTDNFFVILGHFLVFFQLLTSKVKTWKQYKKHLEILCFYTSVS